MADFWYFLTTDDQAVDSVIFRCKVYLNRKRKQFVAHQGHLLRRGKPALQNTVFMANLNKCILD